MKTKFEFDFFLAMFVAGILLLGVSIAIGSGRYYEAFKFVGIVFTVLPILRFMLLLFSELP